MPREPYCRNCKYVLTGLTESSKCPECGLPLVEVLERAPLAQLGRRYKSSIVLFGLPLLHVAFGPWDDERVGRARGIIALGDVATGVFAMGGFARGFIAIGGMALGVIAFGGLSLGLLTAIGGVALGSVASGGMTAGAIAHGGFALGYVANGGFAIGQYAYGGFGVGPNVLAGNRADAGARAFFQEFGAVVGASVGSGLAYSVAVLAWTIALALIATLPVALVILAAYLRQDRRAGA